MKNSSEDDTITKLENITWNSSLSRQIANFSEIISDDEIFNKYFGEKYVEQLSEKSKTITRTIVKLTMLYSVLMLSLFASQNFSDSEFVVFGFGFKNLSQYKELLLFLAAFISPISAVLSAYQKYLDALVAECLKKLSPDNNIRQFYSQLFLNDYFDWFGSKRDSNTSIKQHKFTTFMVASFALTMIVLLFTLLVGAFFIQLTVIYDVATNPTSSEHVNLFVIVFSVTSILFTWLVSIIQMPMPEIDLSNYSKLSKMEKENPEKYQEIMNSLAKASVKREARSILLISATAYILGFTGVVMFWQPSSFNDISLLLSKAMPGAFLVMFFSNEILGNIRRKGILWFVNKYPEETPNRLLIYKRLQRAQFGCNVLIPLIGAISYTYYILPIN